MVWLGLAGLALELSRLVPLLVSRLLLLTASTETDIRRILRPGAADFADMYSRNLLILVIVLSYSTIAPVILPFGAAYFFFAYFVWKHQLVYVLTSEYDSRGRIWPKIFRFCCISLFVAQLTVLGVISLKEG